ncbi:hypothetical protein L1283_002386 [Sphingobacterium sp. HSC-15S19]
MGGKLVDKVEQILVSKITLGALLLNQYIDI